MTRFIFICYALDGEHLDLLRERLRLIALGAGDVGLQTYAHIRDAQNWHTGHLSKKEVLEAAFARISQADAVLLDLTSSAGSKRVGLNIEAGYAKALEKPILAVWHKSDRPPMTTDLADYETWYEEKAGLRAAVRRLLTQARLTSVTPA
ncbi:MULTISPECIES: nucleoside 2-deoxyribosyltransferase [Actinomadura]|uniref:nucleoside 2-deoxyribosyltransferase n=1 Tax=Actinomadura TaxID=1988 RepID=UPI0003AD5E17|nr:nucleoside 2-deoxyribosyltransferase [Actinomadura madurae]SPT59441.1 Nucleoside 2-deoxyribosyltransferase [Actinomadura madurae]